MTTVLVIWSTKGIELSCVDLPEKKTLTAIICLTNHTKEDINKFKLIS